MKVANRAEYLVRFDDEGPSQQMATGVLEDDYLSSGSWLPDAGQLLHYLIAPSIASKSLRSGMSTY